MNSKYIWSFLKQQGFNDYGIAGLMGNLYAESGLNPTNLQNTYEKSLKMTDQTYTAAVDSGTYDNFVFDKAGYGLAQWTYHSRKLNLLNYCQKKNSSIGDLQTQLEFLIEELKTNYSSVFKTLQKAKSIREASDAVLLKFERPADQSEAVQEKRAFYGHKYFDQYHQEEGGSNMKYSVANPPLVCMQTQSTCYKGTTTMTVKGVLWHSTGANNANLKRYVQPSDKAENRAEMLKLLGTNSSKNDWNHIVRQAGLNCWIGKLADGTVTTVQTMPWNYKPWGCGSGPKGSCNNGWIQFEICEDDLSSKEYFNTVYKEACEITAYLCQMYKIDPMGTVEVNGVKVPTILCHADSYKLGLGSNHGDVLHWFKKYGKTMDDVRKDVKQLLNAQANTNTSSKVVTYRVRKTWEDAKSQIGAYTDLELAKKACKKAGSDYEVYDESGVAIYPEKENSTTTSSSTFKVGDEVKLVEGAKYSSGAAVPAWVLKTKMYVRQIQKNGNVVVSTQKSGAVTGTVSSKYLIPYVSTATTTNFTPYLVRVTAETALNVRAGAGTSYKITGKIYKNEVYTIVNEKNGWGQLKSGLGWISLSYTKKV